MNALCGVDAVKGKRTEINSISAMDELERISVGSQE